MNAALTMMKRINEKTCKKELDFWVNMHYIINRYRGKEDDLRKRFTGRR